MGEWWRKEWAVYQSKCETKPGSLNCSWTDKFKKWMNQHCENLTSWTSNTLLNPNTENSPCISVSEADTSVTLPEKIHLCLGAKQ